MLATTTKLVACLAAVSTMECKGSAQANEHHEGNNLPAPLAIVPETPTVQSSDTALLNTGEDRMFSVPHGIPPLRMKHPSRAPRLHASPHIDQAKLEDLQRASLPEMVDPLIPLGAENTPTVDYSNYKTKEEMMENIKKLVWSDTAKSKIVKKMTCSKTLSNSDIEIINKAIDEAIGEFRIELKKRMAKWWNEDTTPDEVYKLLDIQKKRGVKQDAYAAYRLAYFDHVARLGFEYITWVQEKAHPADVLKKLSEMFPGQERMMTKYYSEYEKLFKEYPDIMEQIPKFLTPSKKLSVKAGLKDLGKKLKAISTNTLELFKLLRSTRKRERNIQAWKNEGKTPDEVYVPSITERKYDTKLVDSQNYLSFLMYRDWWIQTFPDKAVKLWMQQQKELQEVLVLLKLDSVPEHELPLHPMYPHYLVYRNWWINTHPKQALKMLMQEGYYPEEVFVLLKLDSVPEHELSVHPMYPHYRKYRKEWIVTYPEKALESWKRGHMDPDDVFALLESLGEPDSSKMHPYYENFADWWFSNRFPS